MGGGNEEVSRIRKEDDEDDGKDEAAKGGRDRMPEQYYQNVFPYQRRYLAKEKHQCEDMRFCAKASASQILNSHNAVGEKAEQ